MVMASHWRLMDTWSRRSRRELLFALSAMSLASRSSADDKSAFHTGVALTPARFPNHRPQDLERMFELAGELGSHAVLIYQWNDPKHLEVATKLVAECQRRKLKTMVGLSPTSLAGARDRWEVPSAVQPPAGAKPSFANRVIVDEFVKASTLLAKLKPDYLCLATEINFMAFASIPEYVAFAAAYKKAYAAVKRISPDTKTFVSFQWDYYRIMDDREPAKLREHTKLIDLFRPELDLFAFTSYPADHFATPDDVPANHYERVFDHIDKKEHVACMEIGWPTTGKGTNDEQAKFVARLRTLLAKVKPDVVCWSLLHDVTRSGLPGDLASTGLLDTEGAKKNSSFETFAKLSRPAE